MGDTSLPPLPAGYTLDQSSNTPPAAAAPALPAGYKPDSGQPNAAGDLADLIGNAAKSLAKVSGPNVIYEALRKAAPHLNLPPALGMPNAGEVMQAGLLSMIPEAEEGEAATAAPKPTAAAEASAPGMAQRIGQVLMKRIPGVQKLADMTKLPGELVDAINGPAPKPAATPTPTPTVPETNGIPWGSGGQGPLDLRGKMIPKTEAAPAEVTPAAAAPAAAMPAGAPPLPDGYKLDEAPPATITPGSSESIPSTPSGESSLRQTLLSMSNDNLMRIARSRGINVTQEAQLKAGVANPRLVEKIVGDFSDDELDNVRSTHLENTNQPHHDFGDLAQKFQDQGMSKADAVDRAQEVWNTINLKTYFPDVKIPQAVLNRVTAATRPMRPPAGYKPVSTPAPDITLPPGQTEQDLSPLLQESLKRARAARATTTQPNP